MKERGIDPKTDPRKAGRMWIDTIWHGPHPKKSPVLGLSIDGRQGIELGENSLDQGTVEENLEWQTIAA